MAGGGAACDCELRSGCGSLNVNTGTEVKGAARLLHATREQFLSGRMFGWLRMWTVYAPQRDPTLSSSDGLKIHIGAYQSTSSALSRAPIGMLCHKGLASPIAPNASNDVGATV